MLTAEPDDFKRFLLTAPDEGVSEAERNDRGAFSYQKVSRHLFSLFYVALKVRVRSYS